MDFTSEQKNMQERIRKHVNLEKAARRLVNNAAPIHSGNDDTVLEYLVDPKFFEEVEACVRRLEEAKGGQI